MGRGVRRAKISEGTGKWLLQENKPRPRIFRLHYKLMKIYVFLPLFYSEYVKIIDGSGTTVLIRNGYSSTPQKPFAEVSFGNSENIIVQIYLYSSYSTATLQFGILQQGLLSG